MIKKSKEYKLISKHYGTKVAKRSQVPLINHINEGLEIMDFIRASEESMRAFCLHPMLQADTDLEENSYLCSLLDSHIVMLAMEYRSVANEFLSDKIDGSLRTIRLSPLIEVNDMLIADKVQNYKDFLTYHKGTHPRSDALDEYFNLWLKTLSVGEHTFSALCRLVDQNKLRNK